LQKKFDEPAKWFLAKATPTTPNKGQMVFVLIHQKTFFECEATLHKKYKIFEDTKAENGNYDRLDPNC
jgi:hypothetical protein